ncbi:hypothetical protein chiPu_0015987 [Chiloscyllium punctatum]|uniref:Uncharacterized protein n=1 Tax=Chiloscyllium punctatum TaxID=137246 RepID=A0A401T482_CHIPU|nr:hypothetical protein [Chiloscyllium punctatum]
MAPNLIRYQRQAQTHNMTVRAEFVLESKSDVTLQKQIFQFHCHYDDNQYTEYIVHRTCTQKPREDGIAILTVSEQGTLVTESECIFWRHQEDGAEGDGRFTMVLLNKLIS